MSFNYSRASNPSMAPAGDGNILSGYQNPTLRSPTHYNLSNILYQAPGLMYQTPSDYINLQSHNASHVLNVDATGLQPFNRSGMNYYQYIHQDNSSPFINSNSPGKGVYSRESNSATSIPNDIEGQRANFHSPNQTSYRLPYPGIERENPHELKVPLSTMFSPPPYNQNFLLNYSKVHPSEMFGPKSPGPILNLSSSQSPHTSHQNPFYNATSNPQAYQQSMRQGCPTQHQVALSNPGHQSMQHLMSEKNVAHKDKLMKILKPLADPRAGPSDCIKIEAHSHTVHQKASKKALASMAPKNVDDMTTLLAVMKHIDAITGDIVKTEAPSTDATQTDPTGCKIKKLDDTFFPIQPRETKVERSDASLFKFSSLQSDCVNKLNQLKSEGKDITNPSKLLSEKKLNSGSFMNLGRMFIQEDPCHELPGNLLRCLECKSTKRSDASCRFLAFRRLSQVKSGAVRDCGFCEPCECSAEDVLLWMPISVASSDMTVDIARYIIEHVGNRFCKLVEQEKEAMTWANLKDKVAWKRPVYRVREICDVCCTTLFNIHWVCSKCGYVICIDCYQVGNCKWDKCVSTRQNHVQNDLVITQIIPSDALWDLCKKLHMIRKQYNIQVNCICSNAVRSLLEQEMAEESKDRLSIKAALGVTTQRQPLNKSHDNLMSYNANRDFLLTKFGPPKCPPLSTFDNTVVNLPTISEIKRKLNEFYESQQFIKQGMNSLVIPRQMSSNKLEHIVVRYNIDVTRKLYPNVPHNWLDGGRLLQLLDQKNSGNIGLFHQQWRNSQPVMVSNCERQLNPDLWSPSSFREEFGNQPNDLVDCGNKIVLEGCLMSKFWEGFEHVQKRMKDANGKEMILKLKDWPPTADFSEMLPSRFSNLLEALPLPEYSHRDGVFNIVSRLPDFFVRPDLGPKMYNAYGSALDPKVGSTNLHLDISDAVNLMVYVGVPKDDVEDHEKAAFDAMKRAGSCPETMKRVEQGHQKPGALWHIYDPHDSDKIRHLLTKVAQEMGDPIELHSDPIHDQNWYLDETLRDRLFKEYGVEGYTIVQCVGDAIFIPAGAPHQVRNLHSCIKAAEDFVSPENVDYCFQLTQEFRHLSSTHSNHEDKLQIKNVIFHAIKDAVATLQGY